MIDDLKKTISFFGIWSLLLLPIICMSQNQFESLIDKYEFSQNSVHSIWQDDFGMIWFATDVGLDRFDGDKLVKNCVRYSERENLVGKSSISIGSIWYQNKYFLALHSTRDSILYFLEYEKENFVFNQRLNRKIFPSYILAFSDSLIYCKDGIYGVTGNKKNDYPIESEVLTVSIDKENALQYFFTEDSIYQAHLNGTGIIKSIANKRAVKPITAIIAKNKKLYIGNDHMEVWELDFDQQAYVKLFSSPCLSEITSIEFGTYGKFWIGTEDCGLYSFSPESAEIQLYARDSKKYQISRNTIYDVYITRDQSIWIGMNEGGVDRLVFEGDQYFNQEFLDHENYFKKSNSVSAILPISDTVLWISTSGNVIQEYNTLTDKIDRIIAIPDITAVEDFKIYAIENGANSIYLGTTNGLYQYTKEVGFKMISFAGKTVYRLKYLAESNKLICGLNNVNAEPTPDMGLYSIRLSDNSVDSLVRNVNILSLAFDAETKAILGGTSQGFYKIHENGVLENNELNLSIRSIFVDKYGIWLGSEKKGLMFIKDGEDSKNKEPVIQFQNNSDVETIYSITNDSYGNIWYSTISGLYQYFPSNEGFIIYRKKEGLSNNEFNFGAFGRSNNYLFWGGTNGINSILLDNTNSFSKSIFPNPQSSLLFEYNKKISQFESRSFKDSFSLVLDNEFKGLKIIPIIENYNEFPKNNIRYRLSNRANNYQKGSWLYTSDYVTVDEFDLHRPDFANDFFTGDSEGEVEIEIRNGKSNSWINKKINYVVKWSSNEHDMLLGILLLAGLVLMGIFYIIYKYWNNRLKDVEIAFRKAETDKMKKVVDDLRSVQLVINDISRLDNTNDLGILACKHFKFNFDFDYSIISIVNVFNRKIESMISDSKDKTLVDPEEWKDRSSYNLDFDYEEWEAKKANNNAIPNDAPDILVQICRKKVKKPIIVIGDHVVENDYGINFDNINNDCFENGHENLVRVFIPIIHRSKPQDDLKVSITGKSELLTSEDENSGKIKEDDFEIGVVELGYYNPKIPAMTKEQKEEERNRFSEELLANLGLYIDNFSQPYYRAMLTESNSKIFEELKKINGNNSDHEKFMRQGLEYAVDKFKCTYGSFVPVKFNAFPLYLGEEETVLYNYKKEDLLNIKETNAIITKNFDYDNIKTHDQIGITNLALIIKRPILINNIFQDRDNNEETIDQEKKTSYLAILEDVKSELAIPLFYSDFMVLGVLLISTDKINFFNKIHVELYENLAHELSRIYTNKKRLHLTQLISSPFDIFGQDSTTLFRPVLSVIAKHFQTTDISIWEGVGQLPNKTDKVYVLNNYPSKINDLLEENTITDLIINRFDLDNKINVGSNEHILGELFIHNAEKNSGSNVDAFCIDNDYKGYLILKVPVHQNKDYLITVFSKKPLRKDEIIASSEEILLSIVDKMQSSFRLFSFTQILTQTKFEEERGIDRVIEVLAETAFYSLNATIVGIILTEPETNEILQGQSHIVTDLVRPFGEDRAVLSEAIMQSNSPNDSWYFKNKEDYMHFLKEKNGSDFELDDDSLLKIADINSLAALKLTYDDKVLGTLMVEYAAEDEVFKWKKEIENFKRIAERLLKIDYDFRVKTGFMDNLSQESQKLKNEVDQLMSDKQKLENEKLNLDNEKQVASEKYTEAMEKMSEILPRAAGLSYYLIVKGVQHDIRNFLTSLSSLLLSTETQLKSGLDEKLLKRYNKRHGQFNLYIDYIEELIDLFDFQNVKNVKIDINELILKLIKIFKITENVEFKTDFSPGLSQLLGAKSRFSMILYNLIGNSIDSIREKREKRKERNEKDMFQGEILISTKMEANDFVIKVRDDGVGIDNDDLEWVFVMGNTKKKNGVGVGLYFVRSALMEYFGNGDVRVNSNIGNFAEFVIKIPKNANYGNGNIGND